MTNKKEANREASRPHVVVRKSWSCRKSLDFSLLLPVLLLITIGCFFIYDFTVVNEYAPSKGYYLIRQALFAVLSIVSMLFFSKIDYHQMRFFVAPLVTVVVFVNLLSSVSGLFEHIRNVEAHLMIGTLDIHMGQLTETTAYLLFAMIMSRQTGRWVKCISWVACAILTCAVLLNYPDYMRMFIVCAVVLILLLVSNPIVAMTIGSICIICISGATYYLHGSLYFSSRIQAWMDPFSDPLGSGRIIIQSMYAIADGGLLGVGLGKGTMCYALGKAHSSLILPAIIQEIGIIGAAIILILFLIFLFRAFLITIRASDRWGFFLAAAITVRFCIILFLYILGCVNVTPMIIDMLCPFLSYGGSALMIDCMLVGILLSISRYEAESWRE